MHAWQMYIGLFAILLVRTSLLFAGGILTDWKKPSP
jgi:hypothetical protein